VNSVDKGKLNPLMMCFDGDNDNKEDVVELLLERGADPNLSDESAIFRASYCLLPRIVDLLLRHGAAPNGGPGESSLVYDACFQARKSGKFDPALLVSQRLLDAGAEVDKLGPKKKTALMAAPSPELTRLLLRHGANLEAVDEGGFGALSLSASSGKLGSLKVLVQAGGDPFNAFRGAIVGRRDGTQFRTEEGREIALEFALWAGASPTFALFGTRDSTPFSVVQKLLWYGAPTTSKLNGLLPIDHAFEKGASPAVLFLLAPHDGYQLTDPKINKSVVIIKTDPGPPQFTAYELEFDFCAHCRKEKGAGDVLTCAACMLVAYCGVECQRAHREKHNDICEAKQVADARRDEFEE
jgi:hypothetical protein